MQFWYFCLILQDLKLWELSLLKQTNLTSKSFLFYSLLWILKIFGCEKIVLLYAFSYKIIVILIIIWWMILLNLRKWLIGSFCIIYLLIIIDFFIALSSLIYKTWRSLLLQIKLILEWLWLLTYLTLSLINWVRSKAIINILIWKIS